MNRFALNSLATGPKIRVPTGSLFLVKTTAELSSNRIAEPSGLNISFLVLTITAGTISPFLTLALGMASLTDTIMMSPMLAYLLLDPPNTLMQYNSLAPELSATVSLVSV
jgi:hypothetical protein